MSARISAGTSSRLVAIRRMPSEGGPAVPLCGRRSSCGACTPQAPAEWDDRDAPRACSRHPAGPRGPATRPRARFFRQRPLLVGITEDEYKHFVVYRGTNFRWVFLADPIRGHIRLTPNQFIRQWQKNLALAISKPNQDVPKTHPLSLTEGDVFWGETTDQLLRTRSERDLTIRP